MQRCEDHSHSVKDPQRVHFDMALASEILESRHSIHAPRMVCAGGELCVCCEAVNTPAVRGGICGRVCARVYSARGFRNVS